MDCAKNKISVKQADYYGLLFERHGHNIDAVASKQQIYKELRYEKLSSVFTHDSSFSVHDIGFGLGHFFEYLKTTYPDREIKYSGSEITTQFVHYCREIYPESEFHLRDIASGCFPEHYDYAILGGTFYHLAGTNHVDFNQYMQSILSNAFSSVNRGLAFNLITDYVDYRNNDLFYADLPKLIDFTAKNLSRFFTIDHAIPLYEYTICVYKEAYIAAQYPHVQYRKYFKQDF